MARPLLVRGMLVGLAAGLLAFLGVALGGIFALVFAGVYGRPRRAPPARRLERGDRGGRCLDTNAARPPGGAGVTSRS